MITTKYITHKRFEGYGVCGYLLTIPYGEQVIEFDGILYTSGGAAICSATSEIGHMFFAPNEDGAGLIRGKITHQIAFSDQAGTDGYRFSSADREMLTETYKHWLKPNTEMVLFNHAFFGAGIDALKELAGRLHLQ